MYQLGFLYGSERQLMSPLPLPTLYGGSSPQENVSFISIGSGTFELMPLKPGHSYVPVFATGVDGGGVAGVSTPGSGSSLEVVSGTLGLGEGRGLGVDGVGDPVAAGVVPRSRAPGIRTKTAPANATPQTRTQASVSATVVPSRLFDCAATRPPLHPKNAPSHPIRCVRPRFDCNPDKRFLQAAPPLPQESYPHDRNPVHPGPRRRITNRGPPRGRGSGYGGRRR